MSALAAKIFMIAMHVGPDSCSDSYEALDTKILVETNVSGTWSTVFFPCDSTVLPLSQETIKKLELHMVTDD